MYRSSKKNFLLRNFDVYLNESIVKGDGVYLYTKSKKKYLDSTSGLTGTAILGSNVNSIQSAITKQLKKIPYISQISLSAQPAEGKISLTVEIESNSLIFAFIRIRELYFRLNN